MTDIRFPNKLVDARNLLSNSVEVGLSVQLRPFHGYRNSLLKLEYDYCYHCKPIATVWPREAMNSDLCCPLHTCIPDY